MSGTITIDGQAEHQEQRRDEPAVAIEEAVHTGPSDADVIREAREALERTSTERDNALRAASTSRAEAAQARDTAARVQQGRVSDHRAVLAQTVEAADAELSRAKIALRAAHEAGDPDGIGAATEAISSATYRKTHASGQLAALGDAPAQGTQQQRQEQPPTEQQGGWVPSARDREWIAAHPRMETDKEYAATAADADRGAKRKGFMPNTDAYYQYIDRAMDAAYGAGHAGGGTNGGQQMPNNREQGGGAGGHAGPSNRGGGGGQQGGWKSVVTGLGAVNVAEANGRMRISFPDPSVRENMEEGAKICYPDAWAKDPAAALAEYTGEQIKIAREMEAGGSAGMIIGEGRSYR